MVEELDKNPITEKELLPKKYETLTPRHSALTGREHEGNLNVTFFEWYLSISAVNTLRSLSVYGIPIETTGDKPFRGASVEVKWELAIAIISVIGGIELILAVAAAYYASKVLIYDDSVISLAFLMEDIMNDVKINGGDNFKKSRRTREHDPNSDRAYRYGYVKMADNSDMDYNITFRSSNESSHGDFPPGFYGRVNLYPVADPPTELYDFTKGSSQYTVGHRERV